MSNKEALERLSKYNNHYIKDKEYLFLDVESEEWKAILKDLEDYEYLKEIMGKPIQEIMKKLKVLEIIRQKGIVIGLVESAENEESYNNRCEARCLTDEEFKLLKEWLNDK